jgi:hypothetical protein
MSRANVRQARQYQNNNNQNNQQQQEQQQSPNELTLDPATRRALEGLKRARATRSDFMVLEPNTTYRLQFDPSKSKVIRIESTNKEKKVFNGVATERISHTVVDLDNPEKVEKTLSLTFKQSKPIEEAMENGYTVMDITKIGESFSLTYQVNPIE